MPRLKIGIFYNFILLLVFLESMHVWIFWSFNRYIIVFILLILTIISAITSPFLFNFNKKEFIILSSTLIISVIFSLDFDMKSYIAALLKVSNVILFIFLTNNNKVVSINFISKSISIIIGLSIIAWVVFLIGFPLPYTTSTFGYSYIRNEAQYFFNNFYFFLIDLNDSYFFSKTTLPRFCSIFLEPGYLALLMTSLLYVNKFNLKQKRNIIFIIALILSFSLAGWIIALFSYAILNLENTSKRMLKISMIALFLVITNIFFSTYKNGDNMINAIILTRLKFDDNKGTIAGYNRTSQEFDQWFEKKLINSNNIFFGSEEYNVHYKNTPNVGWKPYIAKNGIFGMFLYLYFLFYWYIKNKNFKTFVFFVMYILIFLRGHHEIFWAAFPILYIGGCIRLKNQNKYMKPPC